jgi:hydroxypyruvate reductase
MKFNLNTENPAERYRRDLLTIFQAALQRVNGERCIAEWLSAGAGEPCAVIAIGKAASAMMLGARHSLGDNLLEGLVITREGYTNPCLSNHPVIRQIESAHPVPDARSLVAGQVLLDFIAEQPQERSLLFLISGGASSLVEVLSDGITLEDLQRLNGWLLSSGLDIRQMNSLRRRISRIKGGGLVSYLEGRSARVLLISDVPGDDPAIIGSGLLHPSQQETVLRDFPHWLSALQAQASPQETAPVPHHLVATSAQAVAAAVQRASELGYAVQGNMPFLQGDAAEQGARFGDYLLCASPGMYILGGETTVALPAHPGRGGRNQHLALSAAQIIAGRDDILILVAGTDGSDGPGEDAGALVDGQTWQRAIYEDLDPDLALAQADSGTILEATGDLLSTGPTDTNVMDLLMGLRLPVKM